MAQSLVARSHVTASEARMMLQKIKLDNMRRGSAILGESFMPAVAAGMGYKATPTTATSKFERRVRGKPLGTQSFRLNASFAQQAQPDPVE